MKLIKKMRTGLSVPKKISSDHYLISSALVMLTGIIKGLFGGIFIIYNLFTASIAQILYPMMIMMHGRSGVFFFLLSYILAKIFFIQQHAVLLVPKISTPAGFVI